MKKIELSIYSFSELSDEAKNKAISDFRNIGSEYHWIDEGIDSIKAFCRYLGVSDKLEYSLSPYSHSYIKASVSPQDFRGLKVKNIDIDKSLTGYYLDNAILEKFKDRFSNEGDSYNAFLDTLYDATQWLISEMEYQDSDEYISEFLEMNEYEFLENGSIYH